MHYRMVKRIVIGWILLIVLVCLLGRVTVAAPDAGGSAADILGAGYGCFLANGDRSNGSMGSGMKFSRAWPDCAFSSGEEHCTAGLHRFSVVFKVGR